MYDSKQDPQLAGQRNRKIALSGLGLGMLLLAVLVIEARVSEHEGGDSSAANDPVVPKSGPAEAGRPAGKAVETSPLEDLKTPPKRAPRMIGVGSPRMVPIETDPIGGIPSPEVDPRKIPPSDKPAGSGAASGK